MTEFGTMGNSFADAHDLVDADRKELDLAYAFDAVDLANPSGYSLIQLKDVFTRWDSAFSEKGWRRVGNDESGIRYDH